MVRPLKETLAPSSFAYSVIPFQRSESLKSERLLSLGCDLSSDPICVNVTRYLMNAYTPSDSLSRSLALPPPSSARSSEIFMIISSGSSLPRHAPSPLLWPPLWPPLRPPWRSCYVLISSTAQYSHVLQKHTNLLRKRVPMLHRH